MISKVLLCLFEKFEVFEKQPPVVVPQGFKTSEVVNPYQKARDPKSKGLTFLAREYTQATLAELVPVLGPSRPESVPNLTKRFSTWLAGPTDARENLKKLRRQLGLGNN